jgi:hypothetical protein
MSSRLALEPQQDLIMKNEKKNKTKQKTPTKPLCFLAWILYSSRVWLDLRTKLYACGVVSNQVETQSCGDWAIASVGAHGEEIEAEARL